MLSIPVNAYPFNKTLYLHCPYCGRIHVHGDAEGGRVPHCSHRPRLSGEYVLRRVDDPDTGKRMSRRAGRVWLPPSTERPWVLEYAFGSVWVVYSSAETLDQALVLASEWSGLIGGRMRARHRGSRAARYFEAGKEVAKGLRLAKAGEAW